MTAPVTVQISLSPGDWRLAGPMLDHQTRILSPVADEILLTLDMRRSRGRFGGQWEAGADRIRELAASTPGTRVETVDYDRMEAVARRFFKRDRMPAKDWRGGPFFSYFYALYAARNDLVFHLDADVFLGGDPAPWFTRALELLKTETEIITVSPLPGPPTEDGSLRSQQTRFDRPLGGFVFDSISTRLFLLDRRRLVAELGPLGLEYPSLANAARAFLRRQALAELPEVILSRQMMKRGKQRLDFAGPPPGFWSLHPPYRSESFFRLLPALIDRVERGDMPAGQHGCHDINDSLVDWSAARSRLHDRAWHRRLLASLRISRGGH